MVWKYGIESMKAKLFSIHSAAGWQFQPSQSESCFFSFLDIMIWEDLMPLLVNDQL